MEKLQKYKIAFQKFLESEGGEICVNCKTFEEALYGLQEEMKSVDYGMFYDLAYHVQDRIYYWDIYKENTVFYLSANGGSFGEIGRAKKKGKKVFSYKGFVKSMNYFYMQITKERTYSHENI